MVENGGTRGEETALAHAHAQFEAETQISDCLHTAVLFMMNKVKQNHC